MKPKLTVPFVSAIIVFRNEEEYLNISISSLLDQDYPIENYEIILVDSMSDDNSVNVVENLIIKKKQLGVFLPNIKFLKNPALNLASGWNMGIRESSGDYVFRIDAHASINTDYIKRCVQALDQNQDAICVGGHLKSSAINKTGLLVAKVLSSPFGVGNSTFRIGGSPGFVDTVAYGMYRKQIFDKVGLFNEKMHRNQDNDMHARIRENGGKFYFDPQINATYFVRSSVKAMLHQSFQNGVWNAIILVSNPTALAIRHLVPCVFVLGIISLLVVSLVYKLFIYILLGMLALYFLLAIIFACRTADRITDVFKIFPLFFLLHLAYGCGTIYGLIRSKKMKVKL